MLYELLARHTDIVREVAIGRFRVVESAHELRASIVLLDGSVLHVRDYLFLDGIRKYAYHWQTARGRLRSRWDNSGHWPDVESHPHHAHVGRIENVRSSAVRDLAGALRAIAETLQQPRRRAGRRAPPPSHRGRRRREGR